MSGGGAPTPPTPYDPYGVSAAQGQYNYGAAGATQAMNAVNQSNPFGSLTYTQTGTGPGGVPIYSAATSLSPTEQALFNQYTSGQSGLGSEANALIKATGGQYSTAPDLTGTTNSLTANMLANEVASLSPYFKTQQNALTSQLASEGIAPTQGGATNPAAGGASTGGTVNPAWATAEQALQGNQNQAVTGFLAQAQPAAFQESLTAYETPLNNILTMLGAATPTTYNAGAVQTPTTQVQPPNLEGAIAQAEQQQQAVYQDQMQQYSSMLSGMFGIPTAIAGGLARSGAFNNLLSALPAVAAA